MEGGGDGLPSFVFDGVSEQSWIDRAIFGGHIVAFFSMDGGGFGDRRHVYPIFFIVEYTLIDKNINSIQD